MERKKGKGKGTEEEGRNEGRTKGRKKIELEERRYCLKGTFENRN